MKDTKRTVTCGELNKSYAGKTVILNGWVHKNRDHGGVHFIVLRDRYGITQVIIDEAASAELKAIGESLKYEYCIAVEGVVRARPDSMINKDMATGEIELVAEKIEILNKCEVLPFPVSDGESEANEQLRLEYRYIDLRSGKMQERMILRSKVSASIRNFLAKEGFLEIETPTLIKSTPEGARDFLVPSRVYPGSFFALPQSPQLYKQILMVSGFDKYYQIARCYRDEDARGDRQLEFTQVDLEMSFAGKEEVFAVIEKMMGSVFKETLDVSLPAKFERITYHDALNTYGSDKPELRFEMKFIDFAPFVADGDFSVFKEVLASGGAVKAIIVPQAAADYSRKKITELEDTAKQFGAKGLAWMKVTDEGLDGGISKFYASSAESIKTKLSAKAGDLILLMGADWKTACTSLGAVRVRLGKDLKLIDESKFTFAWIDSFPLFEWNEDENKWDPAHHMFSMPAAQYVDTMEENPGEVTGDIYDLVLNGYELASGSVRVHNPEIQSRIFKLVGFPEDEAEKRFGFLLKALRYGAPPHAGIAPGLDRLLMIMTNTDSIREVIAFPKNAQATSPMDNSPSPVEESVLKDLSLQVTKAPSKE